MLWFSDSENNTYEKCHSWIPFIFQHYRGTLGACPISTWSSLSCHMSNQLNSTMRTDNCRSFAIIFFFFDTHGSWLEFTEANSLKILWYKLLFAHHRSLTKNGTQHDSGDNAHILFSSKNLTFGVLSNWTYIFKITRFAPRNAGNRI